MQKNEGPHKGANDGTNQAPVAGANHAAHLRKNEDAYKGSNDGVDAGPNHAADLQTNQGPHQGTY
jgi:hypothetical protein